MAKKQEPLSSASFRLVVALWHDITTHTTGWRPVEEVGPLLLEVVTAGFVVYEDKKSITLVTEITDTQETS